MLRDEIADVLIGAGLAESFAYKYSDCILALPEMQELLRKAERLDVVFGDYPREKGWFHKDDPIEGLKVEEMRDTGGQNPDGSWIEVPEVRPLTLGELPALILSIIDHQLYMNADRPLELPSGGRVRRCP